MLQPNDGRLRTLQTKASRSRRVAVRRPSAALAQASNSSAQAGTGELRRYYERLLRAFGPQGWWPARTRLEVILGAILTQNTTWNNAARAVAQLRERGLLSLKRLRSLAEADLQSLIRPAGFFVQKSRAIRGFVAWLDAAHGGSLDRMFAMPTERLRAALLELGGIGPETADAILLYAGGKPVFVSDAYTRRILARHGLLRESSTYGQAQTFIHTNLERDAAVYNEFHALLVEVGKRYCRRTRTECGACPLGIYISPGGRNPVPQGSD